MSSPKEKKKAYNHAAWIKRKERSENDPEFAEKLRQERLEYKRRRLEREPDYLEKVAAKAKERYEQRKREEEEFRKIAAEKKAYARQVLGL